MNIKEKIAAWYALADKLVQTSAQICADAEIPVTEKRTADPQVLSLTLLGRTRNNFKGMLLLAREGLVVEARTLARSCLENLFHVSGLQRRGDEFVHEMLHDEMASRKNRGGFIIGKPQRTAGFEAGQEEKLREYLRSLDKQYPKARFISPKGAAADGPVEDMYVFYSQISADAAHPTVTSLNRHVVVFEENGEKLLGLDVAPVPGQEEIENTLQLASCAFLGVCVAINEIVKSKAANDQLMKATDEYVRLNVRTKQIA